MKYIKVPILNTEEYSSFFGNQSCGAQPEITEDGDIKLLGFDIGQAKIIENVRTNGNKETQTILAKMLVSPRSSWVKIKFYSYDDINNKEEFIESYYIPLWLFQPSIVDTDIFNEIYKVMKNDSHDYHSEKNLEKSQNKNRKSELEDLKTESKNRNLKKSRKKNKKTKLKQTFKIEVDASDVKVHKFDEYGKSDNND